MRGQQREEGEGVIDENPELQALGGGQDTSVHYNHTHRHTFVNAELQRTPLTRFDPTHTSKSLISRPRTSTSIHLYSLPDLGLTRPQLPCQKGISKTCHGVLVV